MTAPSPGDLPPLPTLGATSRRPPPGGARRDWVSATVLAVADETATARTLRLRLPDATPPHTPGQHYVVRTRRTDGSWAQRSYSVASAPTAPGRPPTIELTVERLAGGELSTHLHTLDVGAQVEVRGPFGGWFVWRGESPTLLVGGGSGVVPLMSVLRTWRARGRPGELHLVLSVRTPAELLYATELTGADDVTLVHSRVAPAGSTRPAGRLTTADLAPLVTAGATVFVCGSAAFADAASQLLVEVGVPVGVIRVERFGPS